MCAFMLRKAKTSGYEQNDRTICIYIKICACTHIYVKQTYI